MPQKYKKNYGVITSRNGDGHPMISITIGIEACGDTWIQMILESFIQPHSIVNINTGSITWNEWETNIIWLMQCDCNLKLKTIRIIIIKQNFYPFNQISNFMNDIRYLSSKLSRSLITQPNSFDKMILIVILWLINFLNNGK